MAGSRAALGGLQSVARDQPRVSHAARAGDRLAADREPLASLLGEPGVPLQLAAGLLLNLPLRPVEEVPREVLGAGSGERPDNVLQPGAGVGLALPKGQLRSL